MSDYTPTLFYKGDVAKTAYTWQEHYQLIWDGWTLAGPTPAPQVFETNQQTYLDAALSTLQRTPLALLPKWQPVLAARVTAPAKVLVIGDSISEGAGALTAPIQNKRSATLAQSQLRAILGLTGGIGYYSAAWGPGGSDCTLAGAAATYVAWQWGLGGRAYTLPGTTGNQATVTWPTQDCTRVRIWYGKTNFLGGSFKVFIDNVDVTNTGTLKPSNTASGTTVSCFDASAKHGGFYWESAPLAAGAHSVKVQSSTNGGSAVITGCEFLNGDDTTGVHIYDSAHFGAVASDFTRSTMNAGFWEDVALLAPQLVIVNLGTNDAGSVSSSTFETNLTALVEKIQSNVPTASTVLIRGYRPGTITQSTWNIFNAVKSAVAAAKSNVTVFDLEAQWPVLALDGSTSQGLMYESTNPLHPNAAGHQRYADILTALLRP